MDTEIGEYMENAALVFSGGGAKGAYEAGVWKAMRELRLDKDIRLVSGTSAGSLNAALFAQGNLEEALLVWSTIQKQHILTPNNLCHTCECELTKEEKHIIYETLQEPFLKLPMIRKIGVFAYKRVIAHVIATLDNSITFQLAKTLVPCFLNILYELKMSQDFTVAIVKTIEIMTHIMRDGLFSQQGLRDILDAHYHPAQLLHSPVAMYATAYNVTQKELRHFHFTESNRKQHIDILLASSAIPFVFDQIIIDEDIYVDGGIPFVGDNTPIDVAYEKGFKRIYAVILNNEAYDFSKYPNTQIVIIQPQQSLGSALASLDFDANYTSKLIQQGYEDAIHILKNSS